MVCYQGFNSLATRKRHSLVRPQRRLVINRIRVFLLVALLGLAAATAQEFDRCSP